MKNDQSKLRGIKKYFHRKSLITKVVLLLLFSTGIKLFFACTPDFTSAIDIDYNTVQVIGIDNSNCYMNYHHSVDTMYAAAVALKLNLKDTTNLYLSSHLNSVKQSVTFKTLRADEISPSYQPINKIVDIRIRTLYDINETIKTGDDVSNQFVCTSRNDFDLYHNLSQGIEWLNGIQSYYDFAYLIILLNIPVANEFAQFEIKITFANDSELLCTTPKFVIIES